MLPGYLFPHILRPYWSKQHGAWLTLMTCWVIAVLLSGQLAGKLFSQIIVLILLLSGLNAGELLIEKLKRKTPLPIYKQTWLFAYSFIALTSATIGFKDNELLPILFPLLGVFGTAFIVLSLKRMHKSIIAEWITFAMFSLAGLLAYKPSGTVDFTTITSLGLLMSIYFGLSIFTVKARLNKISFAAAFIYALIASLLLIVIYGFNVLTLDVSLLLILKAFPVAFMSDWYKQLKIKYVGMMEMGYHLAFVFILFACYN